MLFVRPAKRHHGLYRVKREEHASPSLKVQILVHREQVFVIHVGPGRGYVSRGGYHFHVLCHDTPLGQPGAVLRRRIATL